MLRDDVLLLLTEAEGYVSGEEMREKLGVTRAAVSQAVRALRAAGYDIDAVTNRGYCLRARPDTLTAGDVLPYLPQPDGRGALPHLRLAQARRARDLRGGGRPRCGGP